MARSLLRTPKSITNGEYILQKLYQWTKKKNARLPKTFTETYNAESKVIDKDSFREFVVIE
jgi:hypothetical protein